MKLISNFDENNHLTEIKKLLESCSEVIICVAFLKTSGLYKILNLLEKISNVVFYIGTDFYLTEPKALKKIVDSNFKLYLTKRDNSTFHPKIYYFKNEVKNSVIIGSCNLTQGGFEENFENSIKFDFLPNSDIDNQINQQFLNFKKNSVEINSNKLIDIYNDYFIKFNKLYKNLNIEKSVVDKEYTEDFNKFRRNQKRNQNKKRRGEKYFALTELYFNNWDKKFEEFLLYKKLNNGNPIVNKEHSLHNWSRIQKELYNKIDENGNRRIPNSHLELLTKEGFYWGNSAELIWMKKWEENLQKSIEYSKEKNLNHTWVTVEKNNPNFKYKKQAQWCLDQRLRLKNYADKRKITQYEINRLKEVNFLFSSDTVNGSSINQDIIIEKLIEISNLKEQRLKVGNKKWLPSQTDKDPKIAELGNWLNDKIEWMKKSKKKNTNIELVSLFEKELNDLEIDTEYGYIKTYFDQDVKFYLEMREKYPNEFPKGEERKKYKDIIQWYSQNKNRYDEYPEWRRKILSEIGIVKKTDS